jgi:hypothetical protein
MVAEREVASLGKRKRNMVAETEVGSLGKGKEACCFEINYTNTVALSSLQHPNTPKHNTYVGAACDVVAVAYCLPGWVGLGWFWFWFNAFVTMCVAYPNPLTGLAVVYTEVLLLLLPLFVATSMLALLVPLVFVTGLPMGFVLIVL